MDFPILISGEQAQSSAIRSEPAQHLEHFFEGDFRQTQLRTTADRKSWRLTYRNLIGAEAMRLRAFFEGLSVEEVFAFTDPWTNVVYPNCRIANSRLQMTCDIDGRYFAQLEIENAL
jgi:hypothetical protein